MLSNFWIGLRSSAIRSKKSTKKKKIIRDRKNQIWCEFSFNYTNPMHSHETRRLHLLQSLLFAIHHKAHLLSTKHKQLLAHVNVINSKIKCLVTVWPTLTESTENYYAVGIWLSRQQAVSPVHRGEEKKKQKTKIKRFGWMCAFLNFFFFLILNDYTLCTTTTTTKKYLCVRCAQNNSREQTNCST